jgi:hypothetical protein
MADFRLDFAAFCLYGVFVCAVVRSGVFASRRWALAAGAAGALLVLTRHLTAIYLAGAFAGCVGLLCLRLLRRQPGWRPTIIPRVIGVFAAGLIVALFAGPVVLWKWPLIRGYYLTGHFGSAENQVRGQEFGAVDLCGRFFFYAKSLTLDHAGIPFWVLAALIVLVALALALAQLGVRRPREASRQPDAAPSWVILAFAAPCLLVPFAALTLFGSPSPTVGNVMVAPLLWLVLLPVLALRPTGVMVGRAATLLAALAVGVGCSNQARRLSLPLTPRSSRAEFEEVSKLYDRIGAVSRSRGWDTPRVAFATTADSLLPYLITPIVYERQGVLLEPEPLLGGGVCAVSEATALETVRYSDIAVVPLSEKGLDIYPFVSCMREYRPRLLAACRETHIEVGRFRLPAAEVALFVRPSVRVTGADPDGWVPDSGLTLSGDAATLKARPRIELRGPYFAASLPRLPAVRAEVTVPGSGPRLLPARLTVSETEYHLVVELSPDELRDAPEVQIHLDFDTYFVPARRPDLFGDNGDMRRLALRAPAAVTLLPPVDQSERGEQRRGQD